ncbi:uncharacterized protein LOC118757388 [Rhagoletis pomonella]|uniref:uncharacterized protein LOC118757388 n=1 Tax=Rhagoletis pomonella TaxID=28610 RepID=UPI00178031A6|nr:uncharacterized protein LOC118757388 [Rhagoletis pomonella]
MLSVRPARIWVGGRSLGWIGRPLSRKSWQATAEKTWPLVAAHIRSRLFPPLKKQLRWFATYRAVEGIRGANTFGHASVQSVVVGEEATDLAAENVGDESNTSFIEVIDDTIEATGPQSTSRQRRHSTDAFEVVCIEQNSILNRTANVLDEVLVQTKNEFKVMEEKEQERKRHYQRMEEIEQEKLETLKKFL